MRPPAAVSSLLVGGLFALVGCAGSTTNQPGNSPESAAATAGAAATVLDAVDSPESTGAMVGAPSTVLEVVDGDTVVVQVAGHTERVRLIGIDTPEATGGFLPAECYGDEATAFTSALLPVGTEVHLTRDTEARDRYDRLLAYVYRSVDGLFINLEIAAQGYAEALVIEPNTTHASAFYAAAGDARDQELGLWRHCGSADEVLQ